MKNKKMIYVLLICVLALWGGIFYRVFAGLSVDEQPEQPLQQKKVSYFNGKDHSKDPGTLSLQYRDPFSGAETETFVEAEPAKAEAIGLSKPFKISLQKPQVNWEGIAYTGYVLNPQTRKRLALLVIRGQEVTLSEGSSHQGLKLIKFTGDSLKVEFQQQIKYLSIH